MSKVTFPLSSVQPPQEKCDEKGTEILVRSKQQMELGEWNNNATVQEMRGQNILFKYEVKEGQLGFRTGYYQSIIRPGWIVSVEWKGDCKVLLVAAKEIATHEPAWEYVDQNDIICKILPDNVKEKENEAVEVLKKLTSPGRKLKFFLKAKFDSTRPQYCPPETTRDGNILFSNTTKILYMPPDLLDIFLDIEEEEVKVKVEKQTERETSQQAKKIETETQAPMTMDKVEEILKLCGIDEPTRKVTMDSVQVFFDINQQAKEIFMERSKAKDLQCAYQFFDGILKDLATPMEPVDEKKVPDSKCENGTVSIGADLRLGEHLTDKPPVVPESSGNRELDIVADIKSGDLLIRDQYGHPYVLSYCVKELDFRRGDDVDVAIIGFSKTVYKGKAPLEILGILKENSIYLLSFCGDEIAIINNDATKTKTKTIRIMKAS